MGRFTAWNSTSSLGMFTEKLCLLFVIEHMVLSFLWCDEVDWGLGKYWKILKAVKLSFRNTVKLQYITNKIQQKDFFIESDSMLDVVIWSVIAWKYMKIAFPQQFMLSRLTLESGLL